MATLKIELNRLVQHTYKRHAINFFIKSVIGNQDTIYKFFCLLRQIVKVCCLFFLYNLYGKYHKSVLPHDNLISMCAFQILYNQLLIQYQDQTKLGKH